MGLIDRRSLSADEAARPISVDAPQLILSDHVVPLEPRLMLDATLGWEISGTDHVVAMVSSVHDIVEKQVGDYTGFLEQLDTAADTALSALDALSSKDGVTATGYEADVDKMVDAMRGVITGLQGGFSTALSAIMADPDSGSTSFEDQLASKINARLATVNADYSAQVPQSAKVSADDIRNVFSLANFTGRTLDSAIEALAANLAQSWASHLTDTPLTQAAIKGAIETERDEVFSALSGQLSIDLKDIKTAGGEDIVTFDAGATADTVKVTVHMPDFGVDLGRLLGTTIGDQVQSLIDTANAATISFDLVASVAKTGGVVSSASLAVTHFQFDPLLEVGGAVSSIDSDTKLDLGLLQVGVSSLTSAEIKVAVTAPSTFGAKVTVALDQSNPLAVTGSYAGISLNTQIKEVGATDFVDIAEGARYNMAALGLNGQLGFQNAANDSETGRSFAATLSLSSIVSPEDVSGAVSHLQKTIASSQVKFDVDLSGSVADAQLRATLEQTVESLAAMGMQEVTGFLASIGTVMKSMLQSALFDVKIPFTQLEMGKLFSSIGEAFDKVDDLLRISPKLLGFADNQPLKAALQAPLREVDIKDFDLSKLSGYKTLNFAALTKVGVGDAEETTTIPVNIDLTAIPELAAGSTATQEEKLVALASALNAGLRAHGVAVTAESEKWGDPKTTLQFKDKLINRKYVSLIGAERTDGTRDADLSLVSLGMHADVLKDAPNGLMSNDSAGEKMLGLGITTDKLTFTPGADFLAETEGLDALIFVATIDGVEKEIKVLKPETGGWGSNGVVNIAGFKAAFEAAAEVAGVPLKIESLANALTVTAEEGIVDFGVDPSKLVRAVNLDSLMNWVNTQLAQIEIFAGSKLFITEQGELMFSFPELQKAFQVGAPDASDPNAADKRPNLSLDKLGIENLANLSLSAKLSAALSAKFSTTVGINLLGFASDLIGGNTNDSAIEAKKTKTSAQIGDAVIDNTFFSKVAFEAKAAATASQIIGSADLGLMKLNVGARAGDANFADANFLKLDTHLDVTLVGEQGGKFGDKVTLRNFVDAVTYKIDGENKTLRGMNGLIGKSSLQGGIVTDGEGQAIDAAKEAVSGLSAVRAVDPNSYVVTDGETLSQLVVRLGDVTVDAAGIQGLNAGIIDGISISVDDLSRATSTAKMELLGDGADAVKALGTLGEGDILDSFGTILDMVKVAGDALKEKLPFLKQDVPLLNFSILDAVDFTKDLNESLKELRDNPQSGLDKLETSLEGIFGQDTVTLTWDSEAKLIKFDLRFAFLQDYQEALPFRFDLESLVGDKLKEVLGESVSKVLTSFADVSGDGALVFDPDLTMNFSFGIDLSETLKGTAPLVDATTKLDQIATVGSIKESAKADNDLRISWSDKAPGDATATQKSVDIDMNGITNLGDLVDRINTKVQSKFGNTVSFTFDDATGKISLKDTNSHITLSDDVEAMFGAETKDSEAGTDDGDGFVPQVLTLDAGYTDLTAARSFTIAFGKTADDLGDGVTITLAEDADRDTKQEFIEALNAALIKLDVPRSVIDDHAINGLTIAASQLIRATVDGDDIKLVTTNFSKAAVDAGMVFRVAGTDGSHEVSFALTDLGGGNVARLLGFDGNGTAHDGEVVSKVLRESQAIGAPRVYLDTTQSGLRLEMNAGGEELNLKLAIGPFEVAVVDGVAKITGGGDSTDPAYLALTFNDIDGDAHADQYDMADLFKLVNDPARSVADLISVDLGIGVSVDFAFQDSLGLLDPEQHGFSFTSDLIKTTDGATSLSKLRTQPMSELFSGDVINLYNGDAIEGEFDLRLPDLAEALSNFNVLALLNNPRSVIGGLDMILQQMQTNFDKYLSTIKLPVVGDAIGSAVTFFEDFRVNILEKARVIAETPKADGTLPTTVDLLTGWFNDQLNALFNPNGTPIQFVKAALNTDGGTRDSYLYGSINFSSKIFDEMLDIAFDLGIPGFNLDVEQGSKIRLALTYSVNLGFGLDKNGFFVLNDTDNNEIGIEFLADAGTFQGSAKLLGILGVKADAVNIDDDGNVTGVGNDQGTAKVTARLGADLYGDQGLTIVSGTPTDEKTEVQRDLSGVALQDGAGNALGFEKLVYVTKLDSGDLIAFSFNANVDVKIGLEGNVLDPNSSTYEPLKIGGKAIIPSVKAEVILVGGYDSTNDDGFVFDKLMFQNVRLDANVIYEAILKPILDPLMQFIEPLADAFKWINKQPFKLIRDLAAQAFPIFGLVNTILDVGAQVTDFIVVLHQTNGQFIFGDFDFTANVSDDNKPTGSNKLDGSKARMDDSKASTKDSSVSGSFSSSGREFGVFGSKTRGLALELPLLTDPFSAINLLTGRFDQVDLVRVSATLFNLGIDVKPIEQMVGALGMPSWVGKFLNSILKVHVQARAFAGIEAGYDLSGIVNFVNTWNPERLLDGVFLDSSKDLIDLSFMFDVSASLGIAGLNFGAGAGVNLKFNDPNDDGKLRIGELVEIITVGLDDGKLLGYLFEGEFNVHAHADVWIRIPLLVTTLSKSATLFDINETFPFGGSELPARVTRAVDAGETAILTVGANAADNRTKIDEDGDDRIVLSGPNSPISVNVSTNKGSYSGSFNQDAGGIIIPAGEGNNVIDMSDLYRTNGKPTVTYTGSGQDKIILPKTGVHVVFAGDGEDEITASADATGTYVIFGGKGADKIDIKGGNVIVFGDDDFGLRDIFKNEFRNGGLSEARVCELLGITPDGQVSGSGATSYRATDANGNATNMTLAQLLPQYTQLTQLTASRDVETISVGAGNHLILTGSGNDVIATSGTTGKVQVYSGAGSDKITAGGADLYVEGGAGSDIIKSAAAASEIWGWGKQAGETGQLGTAAGNVIDSLALKDGADVVIGGTGKDVIFGQLGDDLISGGLGDDVLNGGIGRDLLGGGVLKAVDRNGNSIALDSYEDGRGFGKAIVLSTEDLADGGDSITGGSGDDVLIGGGGEDTLAGGDGKDAILGDFVNVGLSANRILMSVESAFITSANAGTDKLLGGAGNDILIGGGASTGAEILKDTEGSNTILGDFGRLSGARLSEAVTKMETMASAAGGDDVITTGNGNDLIVGGEGADVITTGLGGDIVLGDMGVIDITKALITSTESADAGNDKITVGNGSGTDITDIVLAGGGDDTITGGAGGLALLGDDGQVKLDASALGALRSYLPLGPSSTAQQISDDAQVRAKIAGVAKVVTGQASANAGNDVLDARAGSVRAVMGLGNDKVELGDNESYVLGDDGTITVVTTGDVQMQSGGDAGGADTIISGAAGDLIIAGLGDDSIDAKGNDAILADEGRIESDTSGTQRELLMRASGSTGGDDTVKGDNGKLSIILGAGNDTATLGDGGSMVAGDLAELRSGAVTSLTTTNHEVSGSDSMTAGAGADTLMGGSGADSIIAGAGDNWILGDNGTFAADVLTSRNTEYDGDDTVSGLGGADRVILGGGGDTADLGEGNNRVIGDSGKITLSGGNDVLTTLDPLKGGADSITSGSGSDWIIGGAGADTIAGGAGNNAVLGDSGTVDPGQLQSSAQSSDGADTVTVTGGDDAVILGGGNDTANLGDGDNRALADSGKINLSSGQVIASDDSNAGNDTLIAGSGADTLMGGSGADSINAGAGDNWLLGDNGNYEAGVLTSRNTARDGNDSVTSGAGADRVILGGGDDTANLGDGDNRVLGDSGGITLAGPADILVTLDPAKGGADDITSGAGADLIIAGVGADTVSAGDGDNIVLGDGGAINVNDQLSLATSQDEANGAGDKITTGAGRDVVLGGLGADTVSTAAGDDAILGDLGVFSAQADGSLGKMESTKFAYGDNDVINSGADHDMVIGGFGDDSINVGAGEDFAAADAAQIYFAGTHKLSIVELLDQDRGGNDHITAEAGGDDILIGQTGNDLIDAAGGDDVILGDLATIKLGDPQFELPGQSAADRLVEAESIRPDLGGQDTINGGDGNDIVMAGHGDDVVNGQGGDDLIVADAAILKRAWAVLDDQSVFEKMTVDTNFAYLDGGNDTVDGGEGNDILVGGLGPDLFYGNTADDLIYSDGAAMLLHAQFANGFNTETSPKRMLYTTNMAGVGAIDLVSESQLDSSIGAPLNLLTPGEMPQVSKDSASFLHAEESFANAEGQVMNFLALIAETEILEAVARLLGAGVGDDLIASALMNDVEELGGELAKIKPVELELMIRKITEQLREAAETVEPMAIAAE